MNVTYSYYFHEALLAIHALWPIKRKVPRVSIVMRTNGRTSLRYCVMSAFIVQPHLIVFDNSFSLIREITTGSKFSTKHEEY